MCCISLHASFIILIHVTVWCFLASKEKTKDTSRSSSIDGTGPVPVTEGLGKPLQGQPLNEEMIVMEGKSNISPDSSDAPPANIHSSDNSEVKRDDLWWYVLYFVSVVFLLGIFSGTSVSDISFAHSQTELAQSVHPICNAPLIHLLISAPSYSEVN